jgi:hypothetical protein
MQLDRVAGELAGVPSVLAPLCTGGRYTRSSAHFVATC